MTFEVRKLSQHLPNGVMFNAYPDSIGNTLADVVDMLERPEFEDVFSLFYVLPTFFNSDLDRGFSIVDYDLNEELVSTRDVEALRALGIGFKFDLVLNHLSVGSKQFQDLLKNGDKSRYRRFFIDWNEFWELHGEMGPDGYIVPQPEYLELLFMRKPELPILKVRFPDGSEKPYWNTFYQQVSYQELTLQDLAQVPGLTRAQAERILPAVNAAIREQEDPAHADLGALAEFRDAVLAVAEGKRRYLGQMDLNARSEAVWEFYDDTLRKLRDYGARLVRLDAFAYLHKQPGMRNFFNKPGTWEYLERLKGLADRYDLALLPEIHAEYGSQLHDEVALNGFPVYDFFLPGLVLDALDRGRSGPLLRWMRELVERNIETVNMLGCHDGIPVLDLRGQQIDGHYRNGLLDDNEIEAVIDTILRRGGRIKNLYGPDGRKIAYYQVNATYFSALGEDERKLLLARAIQLFTPGVPQVWYLDLFAGTNDYEAADRGGTGGHKEINRTTLSLDDIERGLGRPVVRDQLQLMRLRNTHPAFGGELEMPATRPQLLELTWRSESGHATLKADLRDYRFTVAYSEAGGAESVLAFNQGRAAAAASG